MLNRVINLQLSSFVPVLQQCGASNVVNNWSQLVEQAQLMVMMLDSSPVPMTFAESVTAEFVNVYGDYCATQRTMAETLSKVNFYFFIQLLFSSSRKSFKFFKLF